MFHLQKDTQTGSCYMLLYRNGKWNLQTNVVSFIWGFFHCQMCLPLVTLVDEAKLKLRLKRRERVMLSDRNLWNIYINVEGDELAVDTGQEQQEACKSLQKILSKKV